MKKKPLPLIESHLCPGWGLNDCGTQTRVQDKDGDRCPACNTLNRAWARECKKNGISPTDFDAVRGWIGAAIFRDMEKECK